jgi:uncharacterized membrane protein
MRTSIITAIGLGLLAGAAQAGTFHPVDVPSGQLTGLSQNGRVATGIAGASGWRWAKDRGATAIDGALGVSGMSRWAQPIAGSATDDDGNEVAALFHSNSNIVGPQLLGALPGGAGLDSMLSSAYDVSDNGIAVGLAYDADSNAVAFRWSEGEGMTVLTVNRPVNYSRANAISADGSTIVGWNDQDNGGRSGVIWQDGVPLDVVDANGEPVGEALAVNPDGSVVVGTGYFTANGSEAWRWTEETGAQPIGFIGALGAAYAFGVSDDGNVIVGASGFGFNRDAIVWTPESGMVTLAAYLETQDVVVPEGWTFITAGAVSGDGKVIGGWGLDAVGMNSFVIDLHDDMPTEATLTAIGTVNWNDLPSGPFAGVPVGTQVSMTMRLTPDGAVELEPGQATRYPVLVDTFALTAGTGSDTLIPTQFGPGVMLTNDYPKSDGIHLFDAPMATEGQTMEFELFNPGGDLFDSDDLNRINRSFGPEFFEKISWVVGQDGGSFGMFMDLESVRIDDHGEAIFASGFELAD